MLVLTRRPGETIRIGQNIVITVLKVAPGQVKIGINAPSDVVIHREEIFQRIHGPDATRIDEPEDMDGPVRDKADEDPTR